MTKVRGGRCVATPTRKLGECVGGIALTICTLRYCGCCVFAMG